MDTETLKYHIKLLTHIVGSMEGNERFSFFLMALDHGLTEHQTKTLHNVIRILDQRRQGNLGKYDHDVEREYYAEFRKDNETRFAQYGISVNDVYQENSPTYEEFATYSKLILGDIEPKFVLFALKRQHIHASLCDNLLADLSEK